MSALSDPRTVAAADAVDEPAGRRAGGRLLFDLAGLDLSKRLLDRAGIARYNPHRDQMALLDAIVWHSPDYTRVVGVKHVRPDAFWVPGHFPGRPMLPGVLMVEAGAQLACFSYNVRQPHPRLVAFLRIEECSFRSMVRPGDDLHLLCLEVRYGRRRFVSDIQGVVGDRVAFEARIVGMALDEQP